MKLRNKIFGTALIIFFGIIFYFYNTDYRFNSFFGKLNSIKGYHQLETTANRFFNTLDLTKVFNQVSEKDVFYIETNFDDIKSFDETYRCSNVFSDGGFLLDACKHWRKVKFSHLDFEDKVKIKISGTSFSPYKKSYSVGQFFYKSLINNKSVYNPVNSGYSFVIKYNKDNLFKNTRKISLLSPHDEWSFFSQAFNSYVKKFDLITTYGRPYVLKINGTDSGLYLVQETIDRELLERDYGITNFAILKSNDEWDIAPFGHQSNTDYSAENKEQAGISDISIGFAQNQLRRLFEALELQDYSEVSRFLNLDYMAKISAFEILFGSFHSSIGDNRRYIYNLSDGRFYPSFRVEGDPIKLEIQETIIPFIKNYQQDRISALLLTDELFLAKRNSYLADFVKEKQKLIDLYNDYYENYNHLLDSTNRPSTKIAIRSEEGYSNYLYNIDIIEKYLSYNKIFISKIFSEIACSYSIFVDSYAKISLNETLLTYGENKISDDSNCSKELVFKNTTLNTKVSDKDIYHNIEYTRPPLKGIKDTFSYKDDGSDILISKGNYLVYENIEFPKNRGVIIEAGTTISLANNISILFHNQFTAVGRETDKITFKSINKSFGSILIKANNEKVKIKNLVVSSGDEAYIDNTYSSGQFVILNGDVDLRKSIFVNSNSDDGINIKFSKVYLSENTFHNNYGDQIDLDYCDGVVVGNSFKVKSDLYDKSETDGLDVSGSQLIISDNQFSGFSDKAISVGEKSEVILNNNDISDSNIGIAVKDSSEACLSNNIYENNLKNIAAYVKKPIYQEPRVYVDNDQLFDSETSTILVETCDEFN